MRSLKWFAIGTAILVIAACSKQQSTGETAALAAASATPAPIATARQVMLGLVIPAADVVWAVPNTPPADDAAWEKVQANAVMIAEGANLLMTGPRVVDQTEWMADAKALVAAATAVAQAASEKNADKVGDAGNAMYDTCDTCHKKYMAARHGE